MPVSPVQEFVVPEAEAEWVGLTWDEAVEKQRLLEEKVPVCSPGGQWGGEAPTRGRCTPRTWGGAATVHSWPHTATAWGSVWHAPSP